MYNYDFIAKIEKTTGLVNPILDGKIHRVSTPDKPNKKNGFYIGLYEEFKKYFAYGNMRTGERITLYPDNDPVVYDSNTIFRMEEYKKQVERKIREKRERASLIANHEWNSLKDVGYSHYLIKKKCNPYNVRFGDSFIAVPIMDINGKIWALQKIYDKEVQVESTYIGMQTYYESYKRFSFGFTFQGEFGLVGCDVAHFKELSLVYMAEGYATANSIYESTGVPVVIAFDCNKLDKVVNYLKINLPSLNIVICADNDKYNKENVGLVHAKRISDKYNMKYFYPVFKDESTKPTDFNDLYCLEGKDAVKKILSTSAETGAYQHKYMFEDIEDIIRAKFYEYQDCPLKQFCDEDIPNYLLNPPANVKMMLDVVMKQAHVPQPMLYIVNIISALGALLGHRIMSESGTRTNVYSIGLCPSGFGKDASMSCILEMLGQIGLANMTLSGACSDSSIFKHLAENKGRGLFQVDEVAGFISAFKCSMSSYEKKIGDLLLKLYTSAKSEFFSESSKKTEERIIINQPVLAFYGASAEDKFFESISSADTLNGFLNRFILAKGFIHRKHNPYLDYVNPIPQKALDYLLAIQDMPINRELSSTDFDIAENGTIKIKPRIVKNTAETKILFEQFENFLNERIEKYNMQDQISKCSTIARTFVKAVQIALVCSIDDPTQKDLYFTTDAVRYGIALAYYSELMLLDIIDNHISDSSHQKNCKKIKNSILKRYKATKNVVSQKDIYASYATLLGSREIEDCLNDLTKSGEIERQLIDSDLKIKPIIKYN